MRHLYGIALLLLGMLLLPGATADAQPAPGPESKAGVLLFIGGRPQDPVPASIATLREFAMTEVEMVLHGEGIATVDRDRLLELRRQWRVRSDITVSIGFLNDCRTRLDVESLLVVNLISQHDQILLLSRRISCQDGRLLGVSLAEASLAPAPGAATLDSTGLDLAWRKELAGLTLTVVRNALSGAPETNGTPVIMLTAAGVGTSAEAATAASHLFMEQALQTAHWPLLDPGVATATLVEAGLEPQWLGAEGRSLLMRRFGVEHALLPELISYDANRSVQQTVFLDTPRASAPASVRDFAVSLRRVDLQNGAITGTSHLFVNTSERIGWFGQTPRSSLLMQLEKSAHELWLMFLKDLEAS